MLVRPLVMVGDSSSADGWLAVLEPFINLARLATSVVNPVTIKSLEESVKTASVVPGLTCARYLIIS